MKIFSYNLDNDSFNVEFMAEKIVKDIEKRLNEEYIDLNIKQDDEKRDILLGVVLYILDNSYFSCLDVKSGRIEKLKVVLKVIGLALVDIFFIPGNEIYKYFTDYLSMLIDLKCNTVRYIIFGKKGRQENIYNKLTISTFLLLSEK